LDLDAAPLAESCGKGASEKKKIILGNSDEIVTDLQNLIWTFLNDLTYGT
jgi:hypothetical protein